MELSPRHLFSLKEICVVQVSPLEAATTPISLSFPRRKCEVYFICLWEPLLVCRANRVPQVNLHFAFCILPQILASKKGLPNCKWSWCTNLMGNLKSAASTTAARWEREREERTHHWANYQSSLHAGDFAFVQWLHRSLSFSRSLRKQSAQWINCSMSERVREGVCM